MTYKHDYFGFVYLWYDRKRRMFCLGSHYGRLSGRYITSTGWMLKAYKKRPEDFKRRVIFWLKEPNYPLLLQTEQRFLLMIKDTELSVSLNVINGTNRYYNMKKCARGGNGSSNKGKSHQAWNKGTAMSEEQKKKISAANKGRSQTAEHKKNIALSRTRTRLQREALLPPKEPRSKISREETSKKISAALTGRKLSEECKRKISTSLMGRKLSDERKQKISISLTGRKLSEAHIEKLKRPRKVGDFCCQVSPEPLNT